MVKQSQQEVRATTNLIRRHIDEGLSKQQIIDKLDISDRTYKRYLRRIIKEDSKLWRERDNNDVDYRMQKHRETLEYCYNTNRKICEDAKASHRDKIEASKAMVEATSQLAKLEKSGPIFTPRLPNKVFTNEQTQKV